MAEEDERGEERRGSGKGDGLLSDGCGEIEGWRGSSQATVLDGEPEGIATGALHGGGGGRRFMAEGVREKRGGEGGGTRAVYFCVCGLEGEKERRRASPGSVQGVGLPISQLDQVLHREAMESVIQARDAEEKSSGGGEKKTGKVDELERPLFANDGEGKLQREVVFADESDNFGHYYHEGAETPLVGRVYPLFVGKRDRNRIGDDVREEMEKRGGEEDDGCPTVAGCHGFDGHGDRQGLEERR